jgi:hypothetical protein
MTGSGRQHYRPARLWADAIAGLTGWAVLAPGPDACRDVFVDTAVEAAARSTGGH